MCGGVHCVPAVFIRLGVCPKAVGLLWYIARSSSLGLDSLAPPDSLEACRVLSVDARFPNSPASCTTRIKLSPLHERGKGPKFTKPQLQSELNEYGVPSDGNSQQLRAELVRVARGGIGKSPSSAFASTDYGSVSRATGNETLPNNKNVQSKTGTEMEVIR
ncbi:hypothetical protein J6590_075946 [Homalodisca vitripennis]|nr:hypothetical protein J6590_075946 [Homalodisca vitripennis]